MAELRGGRDESDDGDTPARHSRADTGDGAGAVRQRMEPRSRAEFAAAVRQGAAPGDADPAYAYPGDADPAYAYPGDADSGDSYAKEAEPGDAEQGNTTPGSEFPRPDALQRFEPRRAGLPELSHADAATYIDQHQADRPWLTAARDCSPEAKRVLAALDQGHGHAHIRHEGWVTEEMNERRVRCLEDPAQLDPDKREARIDGLAAGDLPHRCGRIATRIVSPEAFAVAFAHGVEHPDVRAALDSNGPHPGPVSLPISAVLGEDGHKSCSGWQLEPVNGSMSEARADRDAWAAGDHSGVEPRVRPVETFKDGTVTFAFRRSTAGGYEVSTMYVNPPNEQPT